MSNKAAPHRKFVQTFVLAEQPNGYFVLNDIFRYIIEEEEEGPMQLEGPAIHEPPPTAAPEAEPETLTSSADPEQQQHDIEQVDRRLQEELKGNGENTDFSAPGNDNVTSNVPEANEVKEVTVDDDGVTAEGHQEDTPQLQEPSIEATEPAAASEELPEQQNDVEPTPVASPPKPVPAVPAQASAAAVPQKPAAPKTWANLVAANRTAPPVVPSPATSTSPAASQTKTSQPQPQRSNSPPVQPKEEAPTRSQPSSNSGWQMAGQDGAKRQNRQQSISGNVDKDNVLAYVKNVTEKVDASILKEALMEHGKLVYFDVSRQKVRRNAVHLILDL